MISKDKQYRTRDGREVRIYATDGTGGYAVHGAILKPIDDQPYNDNEWSLTCWSEDGKHIRDKYDLIEVKPRHKRTVWLNVYDHGPVIVYREEKTAAVNRMDGCIACIRVDLDFAEGEGL